MNTARRQFAAGSAAGEGEGRQGVEHYLQTLWKIHRALAPRLYLEIGVRHGYSLRLAQGRAVAVDPDPDPIAPLAPLTTLYRETSDAFFSRDAPAVLQDGADLVFIDGMHLFEFCLRDFIGAERYSSKGGLIVVDDIYPANAIEAARDRRGQVWCGDVWKLCECLHQWRPDLLTMRLDCAPAGLLLVAGLDPTNHALEIHYDAIVRHAGERDREPPAEITQRIGAWSPRLDALRTRLSALRRFRDGSLDEKGLHASWSGDLSGATP